MMPAQANISDMAQLLPVASDEGVMKYCSQREITQILSRLPEFSENNR
jgi:hypothetical protein